MRNKKTLIILLIFMIGILCLSITYSIIIRQTTATNIITFGNIKMKSYVSSIENNVEKEIKDGESFDITNNSNINRIIKIKNIGNHPIFVRVSFNIKENKNNTNIEKLVDINQKDDAWIYKDGWYYYKNILEPNKVTEKLIMYFTFDINEITEKYSISLLDLDIEIEAVQSENNNKNVLEAVGWPSK